MNMVQYVKGKQIFFKFIFAYVMILVVAFLITGIFYSATHRILKDYTINSALSILDSNRIMIDSHIQEIDNYVSRITEDYFIKNFTSVQKPLKNADYHRLLDLRERTPVTNAVHSFIKHLYVYYPKSDVLLSPSFASAKIELMYSSFLAYEHLDLEQWKQEVSNKFNFQEFWPPQSVCIMGKDNRFVTYVKSIPHFSMTESVGVVLALVSEDDFCAFLDNKLIQNGGFSFIVDEQERLIASVNYSAIETADLAITALHNDRSAQIDTHAGPMFVMQTTSQVNRWQYVTAIPVSVVMQRIDNITSTFIIVASVAFLFALCIAVLLAYKDSRPIRELIYTLSSFAGSDDKNNNNDFDFIKGTINRLISLNEHLQADMKDQRILIKNIFFERLLRNRFSHHDEMINHMKHAHLSLSGPQYVVILTRIKGYYGQVTQEMLGEMTEVRVLVMNILEHELSRNGYLHPIDEMTIAAIFGMSPDFDIREKITSVLKVFSRYNIIINFGIGRPRNALTAIWESFYEAEKALEQITNTNQVMSFFDHSLCNRNAYYYPIDIESKLMSLAKAGEKNAISDVLNDVLVKNRADIGMTEIRNVLLINELCGTLVKLNDDLLSNDATQHDQITHEVNKVLSGSTPDKDLKSITDIFMVLCDHVSTRKQSHNIHLRDEILLYLNQHYMNPDISLYSIASRFDLTENYFSRFFKEQSGENFSNYLERIRMEKARELLDDCSQMISDVARRVGYYNINTFYKAFRRIYGISPRMYRKK